MPAKPALDGEPPLHRLLERQLRKAGLSDGGIDQATLLRLVSQTYAEFDAAFDLQERASRLMSDELMERNEVLARRTADLDAAAAAAETARHRAEELVVAQSDFVAGVSHEIRTPLNGILGMTDLVLDTVLTPVQRDWLTTVRQSGEAMLGLLNDVLDLSKFEGGHLTLEQIPFRPAQVLEEVTRLLAPRFHAKRLPLVVSVSPVDMPEVLGDPARFRQLLLNLVSNAQKFTDAGHVLVRMNARPGRDSRLWLEVEVIDTGIGIAPDQIGKLFKKFSQTSSSVNRTHGGSGLGLAICKNLIAAMNGRMAVDSALGRGSAFRISLPFEIAGPAAALPRPRFARALLVDGCAASRESLSACLGALGLAVESAADWSDGRALLDQGGFDVVLTDADPGPGPLPPVIRIDDDPSAATLGCDGLRGRLPRSVYPAALAGLLSDEPPAPAAVPPALEDGPRFPGARVLVVEDQPVNSRLIAIMLGKMGCAVTHAGNGAEALALPDLFDHDIVLMDCRMPVMDGFEAARRIRRDEAGSGRRLPIIALTADAMEGDRERCLEAGMDDCLFKPLKARQLRETLGLYLPALEDSCSA